MTVIAVGCAFLAAVAYGVASVLQAVGSRRAAGAGGGFVVRLLHQLPYLVGLGLDAAGFAASVVALRRLPLFFVQSAVASSVGVTALVAARWLGTRLGGREVTALVGLGLGLVLLAASARPEHPAHVESAGGWALLAGMVALVLLAAVAGRRRGGAGVLAAVAGLCFTGVGICARTIEVPGDVWHLVLEPTAWALAGYGVAGALAFAVALERGDVTATAAVTFAVETVVPTAIGVALLGDRPRPGFEPVAGVGFVATVVACIALARYAEVTSEAAPTGR